MNTPNSAGSKHPDPSRMGYFHCTGNSGSAINTFCQGKGNIFSADLDCIFGISQFVQLRVINSNVEFPTQHTDCGWQCSSAENLLFHRLRCFKVCRLGQAVGN